MRARQLASPVAALALAAVLAGCDGGEPPLPTLNWYVFDEPSGAFAEAARHCSEQSNGAYRIELQPLPADADQQREQLVRRLAAGDPALDIIGMDVIWTPELAAAGWLRPWPAALAEQAGAGRIDATLASARWDGQLWAAPFTTNTQLLWYRADRVDAPPATWDAMIEQAERIGPGGDIEAQGARYEGLTVLFVSLLATAGRRRSQTGPRAARSASCAGWPAPRRRVRRSRAPARTKHGSPSRPVLPPSC